MLFVGVCSVVKGLHFALEAWLRSPARSTGTFLIAGKFLPFYAKNLVPMLADPSVEVLGHRTDAPDLMGAVTSWFCQVLRKALGWSSLRGWLAVVCPWFQKSVQISADTWKMLLCIAWVT